MRGLYSRYNKQKNSIDIMVYNCGIILRMDCNKWEDGIRTTVNSQGLLDALAVDNPLKYARLALSGEMQTWVDAEDDMSV